MSGAGAKPKPARSRTARWFRRGLRVLAWGGGVLLLLLVVVWPFRQQLVVPSLRPRLEAVLAEALAARQVTIGTIGGDWLTSIEVGGVVVADGAGAVHELRGLRLAADYSLVALLAGDWSGLRHATVHGDLAVLDLRRKAVAEPPPPAVGEPFDPRALEPLLALCSEGAQVHFDRVRLLLPGGERQGALDLELRAGTGERECLLRYPGVRVTARLQPVGGAGERLRAAVDVADPGAVLDLFGLGTGVREGTLHAEAAVRLAPPRVEARLDLRDLVHGERRLSRSRIEAALDADTLVVPVATIDLPGIAAEVRDLSLPSPFAAQPSLAALAGRFEVRIDDLAPHGALLPEIVQQRLPLQGRFAGAFADGLLELERSTLHGRDVDLELRRGSFPLAGNWRDAVGSLQFVLTLRELALAVPSLGATTWSGRFDGTVAGSLADPELDVQLALGACSTEVVSFAAAQGRVRAGDGALAVEGLLVDGLGVAALGAASPARLGVDASARLGADGLEPDSLVARVELGGSLPPALLEPLFTQSAETPLPEVPWSARVEVQHGAEGITIGELEARTDAGAVVTIALQGEGVVPLRWNGASVEAVVGSECTVQVTATRPADDLAPAASLATNVRVAAGSSRVQLEVAAADAGRLQAEVQSGLGMAALFADAVPFASTPLQVAAEIVDLDLARLPAVWFGGTTFGGRVAGHVRGIGAPGALAPDVDLQWRDGTVHVPGAPALTDVQFAVTSAAGDDPAATAVALRFVATLEEELGLERQVAWDADFVTDEQGTRLLPSVLRIGGGELQLALQSGLRRSDLLAGRIPEDRSTLAGTIGLETFDLGKLPPSLLGVGSLRGLATGRVVFDGPLAALGPAGVQSIDLDLRDGELKLQSLPRLERLGGRLAYTPGRLDLDEVTGTVGAGEFKANGSVQHERLLTEFDDAVVDLRIAGQDLLLFRGEGAKVRATVDLTATGSARDLQIGGNIVLGRGSKYVRRISILPDLNQKGGETANEGLRLVELPPALGDRLTFDVGITTSEPFEVRTNVFDGLIDVAAALRGKGTAPRIEGTMAMRSGVLRFPGANLRVSSGLLTFTRTDPLFPTVTVQAEGKRLGFVVSMSVRGRYDAPQVQLSSVPPLPPQDLIVLLTTGQLPSTLVARGAEGQARFVGGYLAQEVLETWFGSDSTERGESLLDRLTIETGREISQNGTESIVVEYELLPNVAVQVERDAYEDYNLGLVLRVRFR